MTGSLMAQEALEAPSVIARQLSTNQAALMQLATSLRAHPPAAIMLVGRGTSDHAGVFAKYLFEVELGIPVISAAPSVAGIYNVTLSLTNCLAILISQSGKSPDIVHQAKLAKAGGAQCIAIVNDPTSPLAQTADVVLPLHAGPEQAVAATKSYLASLAGLLHLAAQWKQDSAITQAMAALPAQMNLVQQQQPLLTSEALNGVIHCVILGRGFGYAIALEMALKLKEVLSIHAEAFSSAEFLHGPVTLVEKKLTVINVVVEDESHAAHQQQIEEVKRRGAKVIDIHVPGDTHKRLLPLLIMQRFYLDIENVAQSFNLNPDAPPGLKKITETV